MSGHRVSISTAVTGTVANSVAAGGIPVQLEPIHSGHFMRSGVHSKHQQSSEDDSDVDVDVCSDTNQHEHTTQCQDQKPKPVTFYKFGPKRSKSIAIDVSLGPLKRAITTAYSKLTTPKWKDFKGLRLDWKQRIRLNNVIWRAWAIEFGMKHFSGRKKTPFCYFSIPDEDIHKSYEAGTGILEGMYWKRRFEAVGAQYRRWRHHHYQKQKKTIHRDTCQDVDCSTAGGVWLPPPPRSTSIMTPQPSMFYDDEFNNPFTDRLFDSLSQPYLFPDSKELASTSTRLGNTNADIIQPGLQPLQPSIDEIMSSLGPMDAQLDDIDMSRVMNSAFDGGSSPPPPQSHSSSGSGSAFGGGRGKHNSAPDSAPYTPQPVNNETSTTVTATASSSSNSMSQAQSSASGSGTQQQQQQFGAYTSRDYAAANVLIHCSRHSQLQPSQQQPSEADSSGPKQLSEQLGVTTGYYSSAQLYGDQPFDYTSHPLQFAAHLSPATRVGNAAPIHPAAMPLATSLYSGGWLSPPVAPWLSAVTCAITPTVKTSPIARPPSKGALKATPHKPIAVQLATTTAQSGGIGSGKPVHNKRQLQPLANAKPPPPAAKRGRRAYQQQQQQQPSPRVLLLNPEATVSPQSSLTTSTTATPQQQQASAHSITLQPLKQETSVTPPAVPLDNSKPSAPSRSLQPSVRPAPITSAILCSSPSSTATGSNANNGGGRGDGGPPAAAVVVATKKVAADSSSHLSDVSSVDNEQELDEELSTGDRKRMLHLHAEKSRRNALKDGFQQLTSLLPDLQHAANKPTNAVVLAKAADHIRELTEEQQQRAAQIDSVKQQIQQYHAKIKQQQTVLPSTSALGADKTDSNESGSGLARLFNKYVAKKTKHNTKFWLLSQLMRAQFDSYAAGVNGDDATQLQLAVNEWAHEHATLVKIRPVASNLLVKLATSSPMMQQPDKMNEYILDKVNEKASHDGPTKTSNCKKKCSFPTTCYRSGSKESCKINAGMLTGLVILVVVVLVLLLGVVLFLCSRHKRKRRRRRHTMATLEDAQQTQQAQQQQQQHRRHRATTAAGTPAVARRSTKPQASAPTAAEPKTSTTTSNARHSSSSNGSGSGSAVSLGGTDDEAAAARNSRQPRPTAPPRQLADQTRTHSWWNLSNMGKATAAGSMRRL